MLKIAIVVIAAATLGVAISIVRSPSPTLPPTTGSASPVPSMSPTTAPTPTGNPASAQAAQTSAPTGPAADPVSAAPGTAQTPAAPGAPPTAGVRGAAPGIVPAAAPGNRRHDAAAKHEFDHGNVRHDPGECWDPYASPHAQKDPNLPPCPSPSTAKRAKP
jgi:hypothetical protein